MFGYVKINKPELKVKDYERYHGYYCGLCHCLKERQGRLGQMTLTYDMTFLVILLSSLYEEKLKSEKHSCIVHPGKKHLMLMNEITEYAADLNIVLSYFHFKDDWEDEKKVSGFIGQSAFSHKYKKVCQRYKRQCNQIEVALKGLSECEKDNLQDPLKVSRWFGVLMGELMVYREDPFENTLREFGEALGRFIYLMDAVLDLDEDRKKGCYNPFVEMSNATDFQEKARDMLSNQIAIATVAFEKLPLEQDVCILRNILYEGVWSTYEKVKKEQIDREEEND